MKTRCTNRYTMRPFFYYTTDKRKSQYRLPVWLGSTDWDRTSDLRLMSPTL